MGRADMLQFSGHLLYAGSLSAVQLACSQLKKLVAAKAKGALAVGFDM